MDNLPSLYQQQGSTQPLELNTKPVSAQVVCISDLPQVSLRILYGYLCTLNLLLELLLFLVILFGGKCLGVCLNETLLDYDSPFST